jgi:hypothetical protein
MSSRQMYFGKFVGRVRNGVGWQSKTMYHIEHFEILNMRLLTLSRLLKVDVHIDFHSICTDSVVVILFSTTPLTYQYSMDHTLI